jgi:hypothetical protein
MPLVYRDRVTVDFELLMSKMLAYEGLTVKPYIDVNGYDTLPLLAFRGLNGRGVGNVQQSAGLGSEWDLILTLWTSGMDGRLCDTVYQNVHDMAEHYIAGVGAVVSVEDNGMFDRVAGVVLPDKNVIQYEASFTLIVEPAPA